MENFNDTFLARWIDGEVSLEENTAFKRHPDYAKYIKIKEASNRLSFSEFDEERSFDSLKAKLNTNKKSKTKVIPLYKWVVSIAACAAITAGFLFFSQTSDTVTYSSHMAENNTVNLPDGSIMILNGTAQADVDTQEWENNRQVFLKGEAFFKVKKGSKFTVITPLGDVQVLGTQFTVNTIDNDLLTVKCFEGKVKVTTLGKETLLTKGMAYQRNDINTDLWEFSTENPSWLTGNKTTLHKVPVDQVIKLLKRQYDLTIKDQELISDDLLFTGSFSNKDLNKALYSVFSVLRVNYSLISENEIRILQE